MESEIEIKITSCRICRESSTSSHKVLFEFDDEWSRLYEFCFGLQVTQYGPQKFCKSCSDKLSDYGNFKQLCLQSEEIWKSLSGEVTLEIANSSLGEHNILKEENIEYFDEFDYMQHDGYGSESDGHLLIVKEDQVGKINDMVKNLKDELVEKICNDKIKKPLDKNLQLLPTLDKCQKRKISRIKITKPSKSSYKKRNLKSTGDKNLVKTSNKCSATKKRKATEFYCGICDYNSNSQTEVDQHFAQHCRDNELNCRLCSFQGADQADMVVHRYTHMQTDRKFKYICPLCPKKFMGDSKFTFHYRFKHFEQKGICKYCGKSFSDYKNWFNHETLHVTANYICDHCGARIYHCGNSSTSCNYTKKGITFHRFLNRSAIIEHLATHSDVLNFICNYCGRGFKLLKNLKSHIAFIHTESKQETCSICNRKFKHRLGLQSHMSIFHKREKKYLCEICSMTFVSVPFLKSHMYYHHSDEKPYACDLCDSKYRSKHQLNVHKKKHTGELPYSCAQCGKRFLDYSSCKRHQGVHTGVRSVKCPHCDRTFYGRKPMLVHCASKHKDKVCKEEKA